jgi:hypothetical protein
MLEEIAAVLQHTGETPQEVAAALLRAGVQGQRDSAGFLNPVVRYLNRTLDIGGRLEIPLDQPLLRLVQGGQVHALALPPAVREFLDGFHRGLYAELELPPD